MVLKVYLLHDSSFLVVDIALVDIECCEIELDFENMDERKERNKKSNFETFPLWNVRLFETKVYLLVIDLLMLLRSDMSISIRS